jgi:hypothetical protein
LGKAPFGTLPDEPTVFTGYLVVQASGLSIRVSQKQAVTVTQQCCWSRNLKTRYSGYETENLNR